ncbi:MAG: NUDIX hydrolase [Verrucomicrobia bacterium]|nr:NUDIX hydrolase [Verrucomicrobiota bacterium]
MSGELKPWQKVGSKPVGDFRIFTIRSDEVISPRTQQTQDVYVIDCVNWVNVIALTPERNLVMIEQYRHGSNTIELEIPGGMMDPEDASPVAAGLRELREETGYEGENPRLLGQILPNPAIMSNVCYTVLVENCRCVSGVGGGRENSALAGRRCALLLRSVAARSPLRVRAVRLAGRRSPCRPGTV